MVQQRDEYFGNFVISSSSYRGLGDIDFFGLIIRRGPQPGIHFLNANKYKLRFYNRKILKKKQQLLTLDSV